VDQDAMPAWPTGNIKEPQENKFENRILGEPTLSIAELQHRFVDSGAF